MVDDHKKRLTPIFRFFWKDVWQQWSKSSWHKSRYRFFWKPHHKFVNKKKFESNFIMSRALFWVAQPKKINYFSTDFVEIATFLACEFFFHSFFPIFFSVFLQTFFIRIFFQHFFFIIRLKIINFRRAIARIRIRPFELKSGEKYRMLHEGK